MRNRQWGIRVGEPIQNRRGFFTFPALGLIALYGTILMGWAMIYDLATNGGMDSHWF